METNLNMWLQRTVKAAIERGEWKSQHNMPGTICKYLGWWMLRIDDTVFLAELNPDGTGGNLVGKMTVTA